MFVGKKEDKKSAGEPPAGQRPPSGVAGKILGAAQAFYSRLPLAPFLDRQTSAILYACAAAYVVFVAYLFLAAAPNEKNYSMSLVEGALHKNAELALFPGEKYAYLAKQDGESHAFSYEILQKPGCSGVVIKEEDSQECLSKSGNVEGEAEQYNSTLGNSTGMLFLPWMLAASEDFNWTVSGKITNGYFSASTQANFTSLGKTRALGRDAFEIKSAANMASEPTIYFIDSDKRILLYAKAGNASVWLVSAPFALDEEQIPGN